MSTIQSPRASPLRRRSRKSIAHVPTSEHGIGQENEKSGANEAMKDTSGRKPRSRSLGPGELDALKEGTGNRQKVPPTVKSILKPTIPLSPPKQIPPHHGNRKTSPTKGGSSSPKKAQSDGLLIDLSTPTDKVGQAGVESLPNPFAMPAVEKTTSSVDVQINVRTQEEQQAAMKEREKQDILDRRDARRKSLANRRVSFAPEATLHTWNVVELPEDATTSSEATNSTRRASAASTHVGSPFRTPQSRGLGFEIPGPPSTPSEQIDEIQVTASPVPQRELHQKKRRRSSGIPPMNFNNPDDFSSSPASSIVSDDTANQTFETAGEGTGSSDSSDGDSVEGESTMTEVEGEDTTSHSIASVHTSGNSSTGSSDRLDAALRLAAQQAGTQGIDYDEHEDMTMELADEEVTNAFKPWAKHSVRGPNQSDNLSSRLDQENLNPFSPAFKENLMNSYVREDDAEQTMEITQAVGSILPSAYFPQPSQHEHTASGSPRQRKPHLSRLSSGDESTFANETMDLTMAIGSIQQPQSAPVSNQYRGSEEDEDLSMEFTSVVGGVIGRISQPLYQNHLDKPVPQVQQRFQGHHQSLGEEYINYEEDMDVTIAFGRILESITERTEPDEDRTQPMDVTATGEILSSDLQTEDLSTAKKLMVLEAESETQASSLFRKGTIDKVSNVTKGPADGSPVHTASILSGRGSPSVSQNQNRSSARGNKSTAILATPKSASRQSTPVKKPSTPAKQITPKPPRPTTPGKTPPSKNVSLRTGSPKKLFKAKIKELISTPQPSIASSKLNLNGDLSITFPSIVPTPQSHRRVSGAGIDKEGLGSPRVAAILDRRGSIGEQARSFTPQNPSQFNVRFEDPKTVEWDVENERIIEQGRKSAQGFFLTASDAEEERDITANLKDMIQSMSPKKNKLRGRKSLHIGAAKGILGKRPIELDQNEEDEQSPKRLRKGQERSPVKNVRLPAPPSKLETIGRATKTPGSSLADLSSNVTPNLTSLEVFTPSTSGVKMSKSTDVASNTLPPSEHVNSKPDGLSGEDSEPKSVADRIHLQDFLNMTSIRFIELTSTKRRHTVAQHNKADDSIKFDFKRGDDANHDSTESALESYVVAGACTIPMLDMYQHSCHELKKYIAEGRGVVREIEDDTFEENPALFREYMDASPELRAIMDNQFRNIKTHARLLSKEQWYQWRMQLLDGLKEGLLRIGEGMSEDAKVLAQQERLLNSILPGLTKEHEALESEAKLLQTQAEELASCDQEELSRARDQLLNVDLELEAKKQKLAALEQQQKDLDDAISQKVQRKQECIEDIKEAEKIREECRGWSSSEVASLKAEVDALEEKYGWNIISASGNAFTFSYRRTLHLFLTPSSFLARNQTTPINPENSPISLVYVADTHEYRPVPLSTEKRFFLQVMRARLQCLQQSRCSLKSVLSFVGSSWDQTCHIAEEARLLNSTYIAEPVIQSDDVLAVKAMVLLREKRTKVEVLFRVIVGGERPLEMMTSVDVQAYVVYGGGIDKERMTEFLRKRVAGSVEVGVWGRAVRELGKKLVGKGKEAV